MDVISDDPATSKVKVMCSMKVTGNIFKEVAALTTYLADHFLEIKQCWAQCCATHFVLLDLDSG